MRAVAVAGERRGLPRPVKVGLVAAVIGMYLCTVGMVGRFNEREVITGLITLGRTMLVLVFLGAGYRVAIAARRDDPEAGDAGALASGAVAGAIAGVGPAALLLLIESSLNTQAIFPALGGALAGILSFDQSAIVGLTLQIGVGALLGAAGGGLAVLAPRIRRPLLVGLVAVLGMSLAEPLLGQILEGLSLPTEWLYEAGGLAISGAIIVFVVAVGLALFRATRGDAVRERVEALPEGGRRSLRVIGVLAVIGVLVALPILGGGFVSQVLVNVGLYILLGLGLNIVVGYAGLLDLGYVAFYAVGAYSIAVFTSTASFLVTSEEVRFAESGLTNFWLALVITVPIAVLIGVLIGAPVLRLRGDYLAIVTLGFGEIVRTLVLSEWLSPWLGGAQGILQVPDVPPEALDFGDPQRLYYVIFIFCALAAYVSYRLQGSRVGRAWAAMREDESVAEAMGISVIRYKLLAFGMGAAVGCLGGAFFAAQIGSIFPNTFALLVSINVLAILVLGGMGSIPGVVIGSFVLVGLPDLLREFAEFRLLIFGAILVSIMVLRPEGLLPNVRRRRELHAEEAEEEMFEQRVGDEAETEPQVTAGVERGPGDSGPREKTP
jgi:branched-chain amino acid transport system permease protein